MTCKDNRLEIIDGGLGCGVIYVLGRWEVSEPELITPPFVTKKGIEVVAVATRGNNRFILTKEMLGDVVLMKSANAPDWLLSL